MLVNGYSWKYHHFLLQERPEITYEDTIIKDFTTTWNFERIPPFDVMVQSVKPYHQFIHGYNHSTTGIKLTFNRNSLGLLPGKFYGPMAIFALLSMLSYSIAEEMV